MEAASLRSQAHTAPSSVPQKAMEALSGEKQAAEGAPLRQTRTFCGADGWETFQTQRKERRDRSWSGAAAWAVRRMEDWSGAKEASVTGRFWRKLYLLQREREAHCPWGCRKCCILRTLQQ